MNSKENISEFDPSPIPQLSDALMAEINTFLKAEKQHDRMRERKFGQVRQIIQARVGGQQFVAVGDELFASAKWKTFMDFLFDYSKMRLGGEWGEKEIAKPREERHEIIKWYEVLCKHMQKSERGDDGLFRVSQNGVTRCFLTLAYDLYVLEHHQTLQSRILRRLRQKNQFQGARYELFVTATMIRAGFDIEFEDETDSSRKHPEFIATHKRTGQKLCVEAKSKHRDGILGRSGTRAPDTDLKIKVRSLLNDALQKPAKYPYVIFVDVNLPTNTVNPESQFDEMEKQAMAVWTPSRENPAPFAMIELTNFPYHYDLDREKSMFLVNWIVPAFYQPTLDYPEVLHEIHGALAKYGNIPKTFV